MELAAETPPDAVLPQHQSVEWTTMLSSLPPEVATRLGETTKSFTEAECAELAVVWRKLQDVMWAKGQTPESCVARAEAEQSEKDPKKKTLAWELVVSLVISQSNAPHPRPSESALSEQCRLCGVLLTALGFKALPPLTLRRYTRPRQSFPESFEQEMQLALEIEARLVRCFENIHAGKEPPLSGPHETLGALALVLAFDAGVLSVSELRAILRAQHEPVRAVDGNYYIWLKLAESRSSVQEYRRVLLPDLSAALAIAGRTPNEEPQPNIKKGLKAIARRLGYPSQHRLSITAIHRGVGARLRGQGSIPQYVVDYCDYTIHSNSLNESAWRRLEGYVPWPDDLIPEESTTRATDSGDEESANEEQVDETGRDELAQVARIFKNASDTQESLAQLSTLVKSLNTGEMPRRPVIRHLLDWLLALHVAISSNGKVRRIHTIRNLFTALAPRLIAGVGTSNIDALDEDDWQYMLDLVMDENVSESWRATIRYSFWHFLKFMESKGLLTQSPMGEWVGRMASHVNANVLTHAEFQRCLDEIPVKVGSDHIAERRLMRLLLALGFQLGFRKSEGLGVTYADIDPGLRPTLDVVHNNYRELKTDSSERRVPLGLLDELFCKTLVANAIKADFSAKRIIDDYQTGVETDTTIRKVNQIIQSVTRDGSTSYHSLRHSAATWVLIALCADSLQLDRLTDRFPFLTDALKRAPGIRRNLRGRQSNLHDLHAVKQLLGHRHEEMTLLHYIHCMDLLRHAAVTLDRTKLPAAVLFGAAGMTRWNRALRAPDLDLANVNPLKLIESEHKDNVRRHDVKLAPSGLSLSVQLRGNSTMRHWLDTSKRSSVEAVSDLERNEAPVDASAANAADVVQMINSSKVLGANKAIKTLEDIKPKVKAELRLALGLSDAIKADGGDRFDHAHLARQVLGSAMSRSFGWYRYESGESAAAAIEWLECLGASAGFRLVYGKEINTTDQTTKKRRRQIVEFADLNSMLDAGASRVLFRLQLENGGSRKSFPHSTFVWALAMYALA